MVFDFISKRLRLPCRWPGSRPEEQLIDGSAAIDPAVGQFWHELIGDSPPCLSTEIQRAAYAILWMGLRGEREGLPSMLATSFAEAAGVSGRQKWGLVLLSSARVSQVTYQTVVGVRYPELVTFNGTQWKFGKYVQQESPLPGGFLPIFWDVPRANIHAVEDIGAVVDWLLERCDFQPDAKSNLAVLHNRNDMTNLFRASNWVSSSNDSIHHLCWNDGPYGPSCPNESGVSNRRSQEVLPSALGR